MYDDIRNFFQAFGTPISAGLAALVAWRFGSIQATINRQQADTAKNKLKFELFEERHRLYVVVNDFMDHVEAIGQWEEPETEKFLIDAKPIQWLFGGEVHAWVRHDLLPYVLRIHESVGEQQAMLETTVDKEKVEAHAALIKNFRALYRSQYLIFAPYLLMDFDAAPPVKARRSLFRVRR